jgi:hypothetical protein
MSTRKAEPPPANETKAPAPTERLAKLVALAADGDGSSEESRNAAVQALRLMREHDLIIVSAAEHAAARASVGEARELIRKVQQRSATRNTMIGVGIGLLASRMGIGKL